MWLGFLVSIGDFIDKLESVDSIVELWEGILV